MGLSKALKRAVASEDRTSARSTTSTATPRRCATRRASSPARSTMPGSPNLVAWPTTRAKDVLREFRDPLHRAGGRQPRRRLPHPVRGRQAVDRAVCQAVPPRPAGAGALHRRRVRRGVRAGRPRAPGRRRRSSRWSRPTTGRWSRPSRRWSPTGWSRTSCRGSQIHQNAAALLDLGLAIVKLDGMYRGMFNAADVRKICRLLSPGDGRALERLLLSGPTATTTSRRSGRRRSARGCCEAAAAAERGIPRAEMRGPMDKLRRIGRAAPFRAVALFGHSAAGKRPSFGGALGLARARVRLRRRHPRQRQRLRAGAAGADPSGQPADHPAEPAQDHPEAPRRPPEARPGIGFAYVRRPPEIIRANLRLVNADGRRHPWWRRFEPVVCRLRRGLHSAIRLHPLLGCGGSGPSGQRRTTARQ